MITAMMDALKCIYSKREVRDFLDKEVPEDVIIRILEAGRLAGSAKNRQPWDFILVKDRQRLRELSRFGNHAEHVKKASFAVVITVRGDYFQDPFDAGRAAQNMMLAAHTLGVGSCPVTLHDEEGARSFLEVPEDRRIQVCIAFGYPRGVERRGKVRRKPLEEVLHRERW
ncbi:MAG TPA: nitroreductase [Candidatus Caldiarchaeum subterraneum]|uniref:Nitroreductase n=1 Tax=Caldiarchaeum subterraneum TaxID=311458 RepID=A0A832ZW35_CALS0|nr:nitroreductase [Candidatus Caldarchaeum subterraneum]